MLFFGRHPTRSPRPGGSPLPPPPHALPPPPLHLSGSAAAGAVAAALALATVLPVADDAAESSAAPSSAASSLARVSSAAAASLGAFARRLLAHFPPCPAVFPRSTPAALPRVLPDVLASIGRTPMLRVASLSSLTGCEIFVKCEFANPGGSVKDRVALRILTEALESGALRPGGVVTEGTAGSTGVSLAMVAGALGLDAHLCFPDDAATEKPSLMRAYGAVAEPVRPVAITHPDHFVNVARRRAEEAVAANGPGAGFFADQFENLANYRAHREGTGPEIYEQCVAEPRGGRKDGERARGSRGSRGCSRPALDAFVCACGTGGTLAGVARALRERDPRIACFLVDPPGSGLYNKVTRGVMYTWQEAEGKRLRNPFDTITEGVGINRLTANFAVALGGRDPWDPSAGGRARSGGEARQAASSSSSSSFSYGGLDGAFRASDREAVEMSRFLARNDGLFLGSSSCVNLVGAAKLALRAGPGARIVTIACDSGTRHLSKFWSDAYVEKHGLAPKSRGATLDFLEDDD